MEVMAAIMVGAAVAEADLKDLILAQAETGHLAL
jgi:hypothetical protein